MKICVVGLRGLPRVMGGVETHCAQLFPLLKERRPNDAFTIIARKAYLPTKISEYQGLRVVSLPHAKRRHFETITNTLYGVLYARFVLRAELLHLHGIGPALLTPVGKLFGMKIIITYHSKNYEHSKWNKLARIILRLGELSAMFFGDIVITVSQSLALDLKSRFPSKVAKIAFIPNGADHLGATSSCSADDVLAKHGLTAKRYIISVGRLVPEKGLHDLVAAFKAVALDYKLVIVGDTDHHGDAYSAYLLSHASDRIIFTGFLPGGKLQSLLQNASLFVLPSYNECMPIAALEAAAAGTPLLLSDIEPNRDLGFDDKNYFKLGDIDHLREKLVRDHELYNVDRGAILRKYNWNAACSETDKIYSLLQDSISRGHLSLVHHLSGGPRLQHGENPSGDNAV
jgi:glycosyltransferase involved in cell wall biosynthesis